MSVLTLLGYSDIYTLYPNVGADVFVKRNWGDEWTWCPFVRPVEITESVAPSVGQATLACEYGYLSRAEFNAWAYYIPYFVNGTYVAIRAYTNVDEALMWVGKIEVETVQPHGQTTFPSGTQTWTAYSVEHELDRKQMVFSRTTAGWIDRPISFNERRRQGITPAGNKATGQYLFGTDGDTWSNLDVLYYIVNNWCNYDPHTATATAIQWAIVGETQALAATIEVHNLDGMTPLQAINKLIDHRLGVGWRIITNGSGGIYIYVYSTLPIPMMYGGTVIPPNMNQGLMVLAGNGLLDPTITFNELTNYDRIIVRGGHIYTMGTFSYADGTLEAGWTAGEETAYKAASAAVGADADQHDSERNTDKYAHVYARHRVPSAWAGALKNGEGVGSNNAIPSVDWLGVPNASVVANFYNSGLAFETTLPLTATGTNTDEPEYQRPFAVVEVTTDEGDTIWAFVDKLDAVNRPEATVAIPNNELAVVVDARPVNHAAALNHFDTADVGTSDSNTEPGWDYESLIATLNLRTDKRLFIVASVPGRELRETPREKLIEDPDAVAWYIVPQTVIDVEDGALTRHAGGLIRDDSSRLVVLAARALSWYGVPRSTVSVNVGTIVFNWPVGSMVAGLLGPEGLTNVFTVVTRRTWSFSGNRTSTRIETGFMELDFVPGGGK